MPNVAKNSLLSTSVFLAVIKDFSTNYITNRAVSMKATSLKLRNKYNIVLKSSFRSRNIHITVIN